MRIAIAVAVVAVSAVVVVARALRTFDSNVFYRLRAERRVAGLVTHAERQAPSQKARPSQAKPPACRVPYLCGASGRRATFE